MKLRTVLSLLVATLLVEPVFPQLERNLNIPVKINGEYIPNAWSGGLNWCQFSEIDLDGDGKMDLFVFDRDGNKILTFLNKGATGVVDYLYAPEYEKKFPRLQDWALLRDYNCDGKMDIFSSSENGGIKVYRNESSAGNLSFTLVTENIKDATGGGSIINVKKGDIPAIVDIDGDGDIDILTFDSQGIKVLLFLNTSKEKYGNCNALEYALNNSCWGNFAESDNSSSIFLNVFCKDNGNNNPSENNRHSGSSLLAVDLSNNGQFDLIIGDISNNKLSMLINGASSVNANMVSVDYNFPSNTLPVDLQTFPAAYCLDVDNDGNKDLLVSPNAPNSSENFNSIWYYKNTNLNHPNHLQLVKKNFLQDEMIDVGEGSFPVLFDYNNDGLLDLIIGNHGYFGPQGYSSSLTLFKNIGTKTKPAFELITRDFANISAHDLRTIYPTFGDLDGDGDLDLLLGDREGYFHYFENIAGQGQAANFILKNKRYFSLKQANHSSPQLIDLNKDGKLDIVTGNQSGTLAYYQNEGTKESPLFSQATMIRPLGGVNVSYGTQTGNSIPNFYTDKTDNKLRLLLGTNDGRLHFYDQIEENLNGNFRLLNSHVGLLTEGERTSPYLSFDLTDSQLPVLLIGNYRGGVSYFENAVELSVSDKLFGTNPVKIYPVPTSGNVTVLAGDGFNSALTVSVTGMLGNKVYEKQHLPWEKIEIDTYTFPNGVYFIQLISQGKTASGKIIVEKH